MDYPNILLSGWSGAGTSSLTVILAKILSRKYYNIGSVFRYIGEEMGFMNEGHSRAEFDNFIEPIIGHTLDNFQEFLMLHRSDLVLESDIGGFRVGKNPKIYSIFVKCSQQHRIQRAITDKRVDAEAVVIKRDEILQQKYKDLWDIDIFDNELINRKYNLVIDNTSLSIEKELEMIFEAMSNDQIMHDLYNYNSLLSKVEKTAEAFRKKGKEFFIESLTRNNLMIKPAEIIKEICREFPEDIQQFPPDVKAIFMRN